MTAFAPHRDTLESFVDCINGGADNDTLIFYRTLPACVALQRNTAEAIGMPSWELRTDGQ